MEYFAIPLFFGFVTGWVGRRKGSSFFVWYLVGFILPAIGLVAAIMSRDEREDPRRECPNCGKILPISAQVCMRCGEDLEYPEEILVPIGAASSELTADDPPSGGAGPNETAPSESAPAANGSSAQ